MRNRFLILFTIFPLFIYSQEYVNKIIPTTFGNINATSIIEHQGDFLIKGIFGNNMSTIIKINKSLDILQYHVYDSTSFSRNGINKINDKIYGLSKNRFTEKGLQMLQFDSDFYIKAESEIETLGEHNFPTSSLSNNEYLFNSFFYLQNNVYKYGLNKIDSNGQTKWTKYYETNCTYIYPFDTYLSSTNHVFTGYLIEFPGSNDLFARAIKIDTSGEVIWKSDLLTGPQNGGTAVWLTGLSDSSTFLTFKKNMFFDPEFFNLNPYPPAFIWLDKNGKKIREDIVKMDLDHDIEVGEVKAGKGDYFYVFGTVREYATEDYGFITKYDNNGDTIWTHTYRHPEYNSSIYVYNIHDLIEENNGDLTVLGAITAVGGGKTEVWVFRVNNVGCFGTNSCDQYTLSDYDIPQPDGTKISCYPNPTSGKLMFKGLSDSEVYSIRIHDLQGRLLNTYRDSGSIEADLSAYVNGLYLIQISGAKFNRTWKVVRQ